MNDNHVLKKKVKVRTKSVIRKEVDYKRGVVVHKIVYWVKIKVECR